MDSSYKDSPELFETHFEESILTRDATLSNMRSKLYYLKKKLSNYSFHAIDDNYSY